MLAKLSKTEIGKIIHAVSIPGHETVQASGVEFNSANVTNGQIFFALKGSKAHGHDYLPQAFEKGAALAVVEDQRLLENKMFGDRLLVVPDSLVALKTLASSIRSKFKGKIIGVVGSVGKTTTKDLIGSIASQFVPCTWSKKSFNNLLGVSYTICNADLDAKLWVLELGMNHPGELIELSDLSKPDFALLTQLAPEHMEFFKSMDDVADAEFEILSGLSSTGTIFLNSEDSLALSSIERNKKRWKKTNLSQKSFGFNSSSDLVISNFKHVVNEKLSSEFKITYQKESIEVKSSLIGPHNGRNFAGAMLAIKTIFPEMLLAKLASASEGAVPSPMRLNQHVLKDGTLIIDDTYNSSPVAVTAALKILDEVKKSGRKICVVLGDMFELGEESKKYHLAIAPELKSLNPDMVITFGTTSACITEALSGSGIKAVHAQSIEEIPSMIQIMLGAVVLFKASRGMRLDRAVDLAKN